MFFKLKTIANRIVLFTRQQGKKSDEPKNKRIPKKNFSENPHNAHKSIEKMQFSYTIIKFDPLLVWKLLFSLKFGGHVHPVAICWD